MTEEQKARVEVLLKKGADVSTAEREELQTLLADEPPYPTPLEVIEE